MNRFSLMLVAALGASFVLVSNAMAQQDDAMQQKLEARFAAADVNHDGKLTRSEAQAGMPRVAQHFDQIDTAHKGYITLADLKQFAARNQR
ncbi:MULTISPECIES: EF-hand domain-containing protein [Burkholderia]|uniref:Calcium-binding protein n=2 Tax=Burkholderiaceae TaxID=119060 RepID=A0A1B4FDY5_9BURK|nr:MULTISPECIES: EF-hand domain-containing protein [Burkholderia]AOJ01871.1 calcium-binding protein [Burkholderia mayonis]KVE43095.1 calcium-binding protein [Burkholderia sp. BDU5]KVE47268.1 calcium-binding protein [Burkholderia mayonis]